MLMHETKGLVGNARKQDNKQSQERTTNKLQGQLQSYAHDAKKITDANESPHKHLNNTKATLLIKLLGKGHNIVLKHCYCKTQAHGLRKCIV